MFRLFPQRLTGSIFFDRDASTLIQEVGAEGGRWGLSKEVGAEGGEGS
jgi:hypothetical protein